MFPVASFRAIEDGKMLHVAAKDPIDTRDAALAATIRVCAALPPGSMIGTFKETRRYGNTSVSQGVAVSFGHAHAVFLNCGTGGVKIQEYIHIQHGGAGGRMVVGREDKVCLHNPQDPRAIVSEIRRELQSRLAAMALPPTVFVAAFVTGMLRDAYFKETEDSVERQQMSWRMDQIFDGIANYGTDLASSSGFFMGCDNEAAMELLACRAMYTALELPMPTHSLGIGRGSVQVGCNEAMCSFPNGINNAESLDDLQDVVGPIFARYSGPVVLALKSGCLLHREKLLQLLCNATL